MVLLILITVGATLAVAPDSKGRGRPCGCPGFKGQGQALPLLSIKSPTSRALSSGSHSETVRPKHAGIYGNFFLPITAGGLSAAQIAWKVMPPFFPQNATGHQEKGSGETSHIERFNCTLRQRCPNLAGKMLSFSRDDDLHRIRIRSFIDHYNLTLPELSV